MQSSQRAAIARLTKCHFLCSSDAIVLEALMLHSQEPQTQGSSQVCDWRCFCFKVQVRPLAQGPLRQLCLYSGAEVRVNVLLHWPRRKHTCRPTEAQRGAQPRGQLTSPASDPSPLASLQPTVSLQQGEEGTPGKLFKMQILKSHQKDFELAQVWSGSLG